jgi:hypothetical protein
MGQPPCWTPGRRQPYVEYNGRISSNHTQRPCRCSVRLSARDGGLRHCTLYPAEAAPTGRRPPNGSRKHKIAPGTRKPLVAGFTSQQDALVWYLRDAGPRVRVFTVDVPTSELDALRVSNTKEVIAGRSVTSFSRDPANEYFLPRTLVTLRKEVSCWIGETS